jgi:translation initiation factor 2A
VHLVATRSADASRTLELPGAMDMAFSPKGRFLFTWERFTKVEDGEAGHKNLKVWWLGSEDEQSAEATLREIAGFQQKSFADWQPLVNDNETHVLRISGPSEISIFELAAEVPDAGSFSPETDIKTIAEAYGLLSPVSKLRVDGPSIRSIWLSPSKPSAANGTSTPVAPVSQGKEGVAIWTGEYKGAPANVSLYTLRDLIDAVSSKGGSGPLPLTQARKNFFKGDKVLLKWNKTGNIVSDSIPRPTT